MDCSEPRCHAGRLGAFAGALWADEHDMSHLLVSHFGHRSFVISQPQH
jgi:hypothetical protein